MEALSFYYQVFDCFALPSVWEGLPVVGVEAQAADLPCVFSTNVTREIGFSNDAKFVSTEDKSGWVNRLSSDKSKKELKHGPEVFPRLDNI